jgi:2,3-bisphosphoglycerate-independent phosphoglycerate mutase
MNEPVVLIIMDGYAHGKAYPGNAVHLARKPNLERLAQTYPNTELITCGLRVGLPEGQMGNSEVGHLNIGAGRVVFQSLSRINVSIQDHSINQTPAFLDAINHVIKHQSKLHFVGLFSEGGVHSHIDHFKALIELANTHNVSPYLHLLTDGRDVSPHQAKTDVTAFQTYMKHQQATLATIMGRFFAMDRDNIWERTKKAYDSLTTGDVDGREVLQVIEDSYKAGVTDEFIEPVVLTEGSRIETNDAVLFMNFRPDRAIQISKMLTNPASVPVPYDAVDVHYVSMMHYSEDVKGSIAYELHEPVNTYGEVISAAGKSQVRIAETQKYPHVTFFFDGGRDKEIKGSTRILVDSPKIATFDLMPEMSAYEVKDKAIEALQKGTDTMILNFANCDMVGHTGSIPAAIKSVEVVDECVGEVVNTVLALGGVALVTADHGNADEMLTEDGQPMTAHTLNPVPMIITKPGLTLRANGSLCDIAPTMLELLGIPQPEEMTGVSLLQK